MIKESLIGVHLLVSSWYCELVLHVVENILILPSSLDQRLRIIDMTYIFLLIWIQSLVIIRFLESNDALVLSSVQFVSSLSVYPFSHELSLYYFQTPKLHVIRFVELLLCAVPLITEYLYLRRSRIELTAQRRSVTAGTTRPLA